MWLSEQVLYFLAKLLYQGQAAHSNEMKKALSERGEYNKYRLGQLGAILSAAQKYGVDIRGKKLLDLGCSDGAITAGYLEHGAYEIVGVDIDEAAIQQAKERFASHSISFYSSGTTSLPLADNQFDVVICYDVFEHVSKPGMMLDECYRVLKPEGKMLIGTWGWRHPYAPHLWSTMPVPWAHVLFSEKTLLRTCRRVYNAPWYVPNMHDLDESGRKIESKFHNESISTDYLNKLLIKDFEDVFRSTSFDWQLHPQSFGSKYARWTKAFLNTPWLREFITSYIWVVLTKPPVETAESGAPTVALVGESV